MINTFAKKSPFSINAGAISYLINYAVFYQCHQTPTVREHQGAKLIFGKMDHGRNGLPGSLAFSSKLVAIDVICKKCIERKVSQETFKSFPLLVVVEMLEAKSKMKPSNSRTHHPWFAWFGLARSVCLRH